MNNVKALKAEANELIARGDLARADALLAPVTAGFGGPAGPLRLRAKVLASLGRTEEGLSLALRAGQGDPSDVKAHRVIGRLLLILGRYDEAERQLVQARTFLHDDPTLAELHRLAAESTSARHADQARWAEALAAARRACEIDPKDLAGWRAAAERMLMRGRAGEALELISAGLAHAGTDGGAELVDHLEFQARLRGETGDADGAIQSQERANRLRSGGEPVLAGRLDALRAAKKRKPPPEPALAWARELSDRQAWPDEAWRSAIDFGTRSRSLLSRWCADLPDRSGEILDLVDAPDLEPIRAAAARGQGCLIVGSFFGPSAAALETFRACGLPFRTLGRGSRREAMDHLRQGGLLGVVPDAPEHGDLERDLLGRRVRMASLAPRVIHRTGAPSFWCAPVWRGERIGIELEPLPETDAGEAMDAWIDRWLAAYLDRLSARMGGDPHDIDLTAGVWRNADRRLEAEVSAPRRRRSS